MDTLHLYSVAGYVVQNKATGSKVIAQPILAKARSLAEAEGQGMQYMLDNYPFIDGYHSHAARAMEFPLEWLREVIASADMPTT